MAFKNPYADPRWQKKRLEIMERDEWKCVACGDSESQLHVHHIVYGPKLWDSLDSELQTLCEKCHKSIGRHPCGGVELYRYEDCETGSDSLAVIYHHCPVCSMRRNISHSGVVLFECKHEIPVPDIRSPWYYERTQERFWKDYPAYIFLPDDRWLAEY